MKLKLWIHEHHYMTKYNFDNDLRKYTKDQTLVRWTKRDGSWVIYTVETREQNL